MCLKTGSLPEGKNSGIKIYRIELYSTPILLQISHIISIIEFTGLDCRPVVHSYMVESQSQGLKSQSTNYRIIIINRIKTVINGIKLLTGQQV